MNTIKVFAASQKQIDDFTFYLGSIIERSKADWRVEGHHTESGAITMTWIQGVQSKDFPVISINNHAVWQTTLPPEEVVMSWLYWPRSVDDAVECMLEVVPVEKLRTIFNDPLALAELAQGIRNGFGLWTGNEPLRESCGSEDIDADSASAVIIEALKKRCANTPSEQTPTVFKSAPQFILTWAFNLACESEPVFRDQFPELREFQSALLFNDVLQAALIIAAMEHLERNISLSDYGPFHKAVAQGIAPSIRDRYMVALQDLCSFLLRIERGALCRDEIPPFTALFAEDEQKIFNSIAFWCIWSIKLRKPDVQSETKLLKTFADVISSNASLIISLLQRDKTNSGRI